MELEGAFLNLLEISAASAVVILAVVLLSSVINRSFTAKWKYWLWMVLAVRLLVPFNPSFDAAPAKVEVNIPYNPTITIPAPAAVPAPPVRPTGPVATIPVSEPVTTARIVDMVELLIFVWLLGAAVFILWQLVSYLRFRRQVERWGLPVESDSVTAIVRQQVEAEFGIRGKIPALICGEVSSPMMIGFFCPLLILPQEDYSAQSLSYILRHELTHYRRRDIWYKALLLLANAVHWFNPAVWLMVREASRDLEISCDAAVMKNAGMEERRTYSKIILSCVHRELKMKTALSTHFYGGKKALKERFANILSTKKRRAGVIAFAVVLLCGALAGGIVAFRTVNGRTPENTARAALSDLFTVTVDKAEEFYALRVPTLPAPGEGPGIVSASEDIEKFFFRLWGNAITEDCIQRLAANRVFTRMADYVLETGRDIRFAGADITERAGGENLYDYTARMSSDDENVAQAFGTIQIEWDDGYTSWKASSITVTITFNSQPPEGPRTQLDAIIDSYYLDDHPEVPYDDWIPSGYTLGRLVPQYYTDTGNKEELAALLEKLRGGERLADNLALWNNQCDAMVYDNDGKIYGRVGISTVNYKIVSGSADGEATYRCDFQWPGLLETAIAQGMIDPDAAQVKSCLFGSFAQGILLYDDSREYFIPTSREALHRVDFEAGAFYPIDQLTEMLQNNLDALFDYPPMTTGVLELPQSIYLHEDWLLWAGPTPVWELTVEDEEELRLLTSLLSTEGLTPSTPDEAFWTDGGTPIEFEIDYGDHTITGVCDANQRRSEYDPSGSRLSTGGIMYNYPHETGIRLMAFLDSKGIDMGDWWKEYLDISAPDEGTGIPGPRPTEAQRKRVDDMAEYLEETLDPWDYSAIWPTYGADGGLIEIVTPFPDAAKRVVDAYTGEPVTVEYLNDQFSKGQLDQAENDLRQFLEAHPEIELWDWRPILLFGGYQIELKEPSDSLTQFIRDYPIPGIYQVSVYQDEPPAHPD